MTCHEDVDGKAVNMAPPRTKSSKEEMQEFRRKIQRFFCFGLFDGDFFVLPTWMGFVEISEIRPPRRAILAEDPYNGAGRR